MITGFGDGMHIRHFLKNSAVGLMSWYARRTQPFFVKLFVSIVQISYRTTELLGTGECDDDFFKDLQSAAMLGLSDVVV